MTKTNKTNKTTKVNIQNIIQIDTKPKLDKGFFKSKMSLRLKANPKKHSKVYKIPTAPPAKPKILYPRQPTDDLSKYILNTLNDTTEKVVLNFHHSIAKMRDNGKIVCHVCPNGVEIGCERSLKAHISSQIHKTSVQLWLVRKEYHRQSALVTHLKQRLDNLTDTGNDQIKQPPPPTEPSQPPQYVQGFTKMPPAESQNDALPPQADYSNILNQIAQLLNGVGINTNMQINTTPAAQPLINTQQIIEMWEERGKELRREAERVAWTLLPQKSFKNVQVCDDIKQIAQVLKEFIIDEGNDVDKDKLHTYRYAFNKLATVMFNNKSQTLKQIQDSLILGGLLQYTKLSTAFTVLIKTLGYSTDWFKQYANYKRKIMEKRDEQSDEHQNWSTKDLKLIWDNFYCAHPLSMMIFYICLSTGCRFEDLFRLKVNNVLAACHEDRKHRKILELKFGKTGRTVHRKYMLPDSVCGELRWCIYEMKLPIDDSNLFGVRANGANKYAMRKFISYQITKALSHLPNALKERLKKLDMQRMHNFRVTTYNFLQNAGVNNETIKKYMGWQQFGTGRYYDKAPDISILKEIRHKQEKRFRDLKLHQQKNENINRIQATMIRYTTYQAKQQASNQDSSDEVLSEDDY